MGKYLQPQCEYCYVTGVNISFNNYNDNGNYKQNLTLTYQLQDVDKHRLQDTRNVNYSTVVLQETTEPITFEDGMILVYSDASKTKLITEMTRLKKEYADYDFTTSAGE